MEYGIDISHYQSEIKTGRYPFAWNVAKEHGVKFAFIKATDTWLTNNHGIDPEFEFNYGKAKSVEIARGAYHYWRNSDSALYQAELFCGTVQEAGEIAPALDFEDTRGVPADIEKRLFYWLGYVDKFFNQDTILYTSPSVILKYLKNPAWQARRLWIASYNGYGPTIPLPFHAGRYAVWQFTAQGNGPYYGAVSPKIDLDVTPDLSALIGS